MKKYKQLTQEQRYQIYALRKEGLSMGSIAINLEVAKSTISREIKGIVPPKKQTFERINISIPSEKLKIIDQKAKELHLTRSAFLLEAATQYSHTA